MMADTCSPSCAEGIGRRIKVQAGPMPKKQDPNGKIAKQKRVGV
jgi:hypothetical protein